MVDDLDLLPQRLQAGEKAAFREFAQVVGDRLLRRYLVRGLNRTEAESLAVSAVSNLALKVDQFQSRGPGSFRAWLDQSADNLLRDELRRRQPKLLGDELAQLAAPVSEGEDEAVATLVAEVHKALGRLGEEGRVVLLLHLEDPGLSAADIALRLGIAHATARKRLQRARERMAELLKDAPVIVAWRQRLRPWGANEEANP